MWPPIDVAWLAGFWEGEGYITLNKNSLFLGANQVTREPLDRIRAIIRTGNVYGPRTNKSKTTRQPIYEYMAWNFQAVQQAIILMWPHLSKRRKEQIKLKTTAFQKRWKENKHHANKS